MPTRSSLREYHLLIVRETDGYRWQIRFNKHARAVKTSQEVWASHNEAEREGNIALQAFKADLLAGG